MAEREIREFSDAPAEREQSPLQIGITAPSGGGKTFSALRLATGIVEVFGGEIYFVDTDNRRALHYADRFKFRHVPFEPPHSSLSYVDVIRYCVRQGAGCVIFDSMSHEHEGQGGMLEYHEAELDRMAGDDFRKRETMKMLAWSKPKAARRALILEIQRLRTPAIFCFRAKEGVKPIKVNGKTEVVQQGFTPIAGDEFVFEMTLNALLLPASKGVPTWLPDNPGEKKMTKLPIQFESLERLTTPLDEKLGRNLALWAKGGKPVAAQAERPQEPQDRQDDPARSDRPTEDEKPAHEPESDRGGDFPGDKPSEGTRAASKEERQAAQVDELRGAGSPDGFATFADTLADAEGWPEIVEGIKVLTASPAWAAADYSRQMAARAAAYHALRALTDRGKGLDFLADAQAFRCYVEAEADVDVLRLHWSAFKGGEIWPKLPAAAQETFATAVSRRIATFEAHKAKAEDFS